MKVDKFIIPANFVVLDIEEDEDVPIILGRPFLNTCDALIDVRQGKLTLRLGDEEVIFRVIDSMQNPACFFVCNFV